MGGRTYDKIKIDVCNMFIFIQVGDQGMDAHIRQCFTHKLHKLFDDHYYGKKASSSSSGQRRVGKRGFGTKPGGDLSRSVHDEVDNTGKVPIRSDEGRSLKLWTIFPTPSKLL